MCRLTNKYCTIYIFIYCIYLFSEVVYHVTIPKQTPVPTEYSEAIIRFGTPKNVTFATPSSNSTILSIPHADVRRLGLNNSYGFSILWFEVCQNSKSDRFFFVLIPSGYETARQILQELKVAIQNGGRPLIKEESGNLDISYIARSHYGCQEFPSDTKYHILQTTLYQISSSSSPHASPLPAFSGRFFPPMLPQNSPMERKKEPLQASHSQSEIQVASGNSGVSLEEFGRRKTYSRYPQPSLSRKPTLDKFVRQGSSSSSFEKQSSISSTLERQASISLPFERQGSISLPFERQGSTSSPFERQASISSPFERQMSISSMDHSTRTLSFDRSSPPSSLRESEDDEECSAERRCSSSSSSDIFDSVVNTNGRSLKRKLSLQSSLSSQNSAALSHSPPIMEEVIADSFTFEETSAVSVPAVPPRSIISLSAVTPAH